MLCFFFRCICDFPLLKLVLTCAENKSFLKRRDGKRKYVAFTSHAKLRGCWHVSQLGFLRCFFLLVVSASLSVLFPELRFFFSLSCVFFPLSGRPCGIFNWETTLRCWFCKEGPWAIASDQRSLIGEVSMHVFYVVSEPAKVMFYRRCTGARCQPIPSPSAWAETAQGFLALRLAVPPQSAPAQAA